MAEINRIVTLHENISAKMKLLLYFACPLTSHLYFKTESKVITYFKTFIYLLTNKFHFLSGEPTECINTQQSLELEYFLFK